MEDSPLLQVLDADALAARPDLRHLVARHGDPVGPGRIHQLVLTPDGPRFASLAQRWVRVWEPRTGTLERLLVLTLTPEHYACTPDGEHHAVGVKEGAGYTLVLPDRTISGVAFPPDRLLLTGSGDPVAVHSSGHLCWDAASGEETANHWWILPVTSMMRERTMLDACLSIDGSRIRILVRDSEPFDERGQGPREMYLASIDRASGEVLDWRELEEPGPWRHLVDLPQGWLAGRTDGDRLHGCGLVDGVLLSPDPVLVDQAGGRLVGFGLPKASVPEQNFGIGMVDGRSGEALPLGDLPVVSGRSARHVSYQSGGSWSDTRGLPVEEILADGVLVAREDRSGERRIVLWDPAGGSARLLQGYRDGWVQSMVRRGEEVLVRHFDSSPRRRENEAVLRWSTETGEALESLALPGPRSSFGRFTHDGSRWVVFDRARWKERDAPLQVFDLASGEQVREIPSEGVRYGQGWNPRIWIAPDDRYAVYAAFRPGTEDEEQHSGLRIVDLEAGRATGFVPVKSPEVLAFSAGDSLAATVHRYRQLLLFQLEDGEVLEGPEVEDEAEVRAMAFAPGGRFLFYALGYIGGLSRYDAPLVHVWDRREGREVMSFEHPYGPPTALAVSPDGARLYSGGIGYCVHEWDLEALAEEATRR